MNQMTSLEHHFLIAMPALENSWFEKTVIYLVEDNEHGSMGLVINLANKLNIQDLLDHFDLPTTHAENYLDKTVLIGGPVDLERGFILHESQGNWKSTMPLHDNLNMTVSEDFLEALSDGQISENFIVCLGFAGWEPGQLAQELQDNSWLTIPYNRSLLFETPIENRWEVALGTLGISPEFLSSEAGHA
ncbi:MAG TPA: YqgE/AlgH family protein [Thiomicrospira sp.]|jgi:putative transcriptional regulator|nr:YqgE/AlgH family protein [Thiomicrospira sp.]